MLAVAPGHLAHLRSASRAASLLLAPAWRTPGWRESLQRPAKLNSSSLLLRNTPKRIVTPPAHALHRWGLQLVKKKSRSSAFPAASHRSVPAFQHRQDCLCHQRLNRFHLRQWWAAAYYCEISSRARPRVRGPKMPMARITTAMAAAMNAKTPRVP